MRLNALLMMLFCLATHNALAVVLTSDPVQDEVSHCRFYFNTTLVKPVLQLVALDANARKVCRYELPTLPLGRYQIQATTAIVGGVGQYCYRVRALECRAVPGAPRPAGAGGDEMTTFQQWVRQNRIPIKDQDDFNSQKRAYDAGREAASGDGADCVWEFPRRSVGTMGKCDIGVPTQEHGNDGVSNDGRLQNCLEVLTEMRYFNEQHKMKALAWNAINALSPELAALSEEDAFNRMRGSE